MSIRLKSEPNPQPSNDDASAALAEQIKALMRQPEFAGALAEALRTSPAFSGVFAEKLGMALQIPEFIGALANALPSGGGTRVTTFGPLFEHDWSCAPPATYTPPRAADTWGRMFGTVLDFVFASRLDGDIYEFGTLNGYTARHLAIGLADKSRKMAARLHLFDTFTGFPELTSSVDKTSYETASGWIKGGCHAVPGAAQRVERMLGMFLPRERFTINVGTFADTLTQEAASRKAALVHIDCDLYESTKLVFDRLLDFNAIQDGTVLVFDDFNCARANPEFGERRAMHETFDAHPRFSCEPWFPYGWHGQVCIVHERGVAGRRAGA